MLNDNAGLGLATAPDNTVSAKDAIEQKLKIEAQLKSAAGWFFTIAVLSIINSVVMLSGSKWHFIVGLGVTTFVDAVAYHLSNAAANVAAFVINLFIVAIPVVFGISARKGQKWAFVVGMVLYGLDALILLMFSDFLGVAFHGYALFMIYRGVTAIGLLKQLQQATLATGPVPIEP